MRTQPRAPRRPGREWYKPRAAPPSLAHQKTQTLSPPLHTRVDGEARNRRWWRGGGGRSSPARAGRGPPSPAASATASQVSSLALSMSHHPLPRTHAFPIPPAGFSTNQIVVNRQKRRVGSLPAPRNGKDLYVTPSPFPRLRSVSLSPYSSVRFPPVCAAPTICFSTGSKP
jgi:hypothetical protein